MPELDGDVPVVAPAGVVDDGDVPVVAAAGVVDEAEFAENSPRSTSVVDASLFECISLLPKTIRTTFTHQSTFLQWA